MSGDGPSRRYDLVAETRRYWSDAEKIEIVREASAPSVNVSAVARRHGIKPSLLFRWKGQFGDAVTAPMFAAVTIAASPTGPLPQAPDHPTTSKTRGNIPDCAIEIELANGRRVRAGSNVDLAALVRIVEALEPKP
jgi:transposase